MVMGQRNVSVSLLDVGMEEGRGYWPEEHGCGAVRPGRGDGTWLWATGT